MISPPRKVVASLDLMLDILCLLNDDRKYAFQNGTSALLRFHSVQHVSDLASSLSDKMVPVVLIQLKAVENEGASQALADLKKTQNCMIVLLREKDDIDVPFDLIPLIDLHISCDVELSSLFHAVELVAIHEAKNIDDDLKKKLIRERFLALKSLKLFYRTISEADKIADIIALGSPICDHLKIGLFELMVNAVEHGNLEIGFEKKTDLIEKGTLADELNRRQSEGKYRNRTVELDLKAEGEELLISVTDQGAGFNPEPYFDFKPEKLLLPHGRGILMARSSAFTGLEYSSKGNKVTVTLNIKDY